MGMIPDQDKELLRSSFTEDMVNPVRIIAFTKNAWSPDHQVLECEFCQETEQLLSELADLSNKISVDLREYSPGDSMVEELGIDKIPAIVLASDSLTGVRYYGIPGGFEFSSLVEDLVDVSRGETDLSIEAKSKIRAIDKNIHIQVFVTPTCPYCPSAVRVAHQMAIENPTRITADAIEASEFPDMVKKYDISAVPTIVINDELQFEGILSDEDFADHIVKAAA